MKLKILINLNYLKKKLTLSKGYAEISIMVNRAFLKNTIQP